MSKSAVLFSVGVKDHEKLYILRECLDVIQKHYSDCKIFTAINSDAHSSVESIINEYDLNCEIRRLTDDRFYVDSDSATFQLSLRMLFESDERYDVLWFIHTKGAGGVLSRDHQRRLYHEKFYPKRKHIEQKFSELPRLGVYGYRGTYYDWNKHENHFSIRGKKYTESFVKDLWKEEPTELFKYSFCELVVIETMFAMRAEIIYRFLETYPEFLDTPLGNFIDARYYFEGEICNFIPTRMGYYPFVMESTLKFNTREEIIEEDARSLVNRWIEKNKLKELTSYLDKLLEVDMSTEIKPLCVVRAPCATRSGYGDMSRDIIRHIIEYDKFDVKVHSVPWGDTPMNALDENNPKDKMILDCILRESLAKQPELFVSITVPNEFEPVGKFNIGITAGIETTAAAPPWIEGCNKMNAVFTISEHSKSVFENSKYQYKLPNGTQGVLELKTPVEVLHNCIDTSVFGKKAPTDAAFTKMLDEIPESFCFAFVGHWLRGDFGEDRKNVAFLIKMFLETFKQINDKPRPALILKTSSAGFSILDREEILNKIEQIRASVKLEIGQTMPNIYLLHGELTEKEMNTLYNHSKVKAHVSFTKGEGFGRPLLEASVSGKPVVASGWSGHLDFLDKDGALLVGGELKNVHESAAWENVIMKESSWFAADPQQAVNALAAAFLNYSEFKNRAYDLADKNRRNFSYTAIQKKTWELLDKYVPEFPKQVPLVLPKLKKIEKKAD